MKSLSVVRDALHMEFADGTRGDFTSLWLRDNRPVDRDAHSGQRLIDIADLPEDVAVQDAHAGPDGLVVTWSDGATASFPLAWLRRQARDAATERPVLGRRLWLEGATMDGRRDFAWASQADFDGDPRVRLGWLERLATDGIAFLSAVPCTEGAILAAARGMGRVLETNYGVLFDVRSVARPENLAYSDFGLGLHTDNPYREPVPGFQALHAICSSPDGGESLFGDGFALAEHLRSTDPESFQCLATTPVPFLYQSAEAELYSEKPLIRLDERGRVIAVHYNSRSIAPLRLPAAQTRAFYRAYRRFALLLREERFQVRMKLGDGDLVVFDNQRALHGRTAFSSARHPRHLQGCYLTRDSVLSEAGLLRRRLA